MSYMGLIQMFRVQPFLSTALMALGVVAFISAAARLSPTAWTWSVGSCVALTLVGCGLLCYAKLPLYRHRRFFTFGSHSIPDDRRRFYVAALWLLVPALFSLLILTVAAQFK